MKIGAKSVSASVPTLSVAGVVEKASGSGAGSLAPLGGWPAGGLLRAVAGGGAAGCAERAGWAGGAQPSRPASRTPTSQPRGPHDVQRTATPPLDRIWPPDRPVRLPARLPKPSRAHAARRGAASFLAQPP